MAVLSNDTITALSALIGSMTAFGTVIVSGILRYQDKKYSREHPHQNGNDDRQEEEELELEDARRRVEELEERRRRRGRQNKGKNLNRLRTSGIMAMGHLRKVVV